MGTRDKWLDKSIPSVIRPSSWHTFKHLARYYDIDFMFNKDGEVCFEQEQFMRLMDLFTLLYNGVEVGSSLEIQGFRTEHLRSGTHLLGAFILFEDRYNIQSRFDDNGRQAWFNSDGFVKLIEDLNYWSGHGGQMKIC